MTAPGSGKRAGLKRSLGLFQLFFYAVGVIVGAGIYSVIGTAAGVAGYGLWLSFLAGAAVALLTGLSYAEMATTLPVAGAEYVYIQRVVPRLGWAAFLVAAILVFGGCATAATVAFAFGGYFETFWAAPPWFSAAVLLTLCTVLAIVGVTQASWANIVLTSVELLGLGLVIVAGFQGGGTGPMGAASPDQPLAAVLGGAAVLFFVYLGFEELANLAEEAREPGRDLPRSILLGLGLTTLVYVLVGLAVLRLATPQALAKSDAPLTLAIEAAWPGAGWVLSAIALFATANTVLITLMATARIVLSLGRDGELPGVFADVLARRGTPWAASLLVLAVSALLLPIGDLGVLAGLSSFSALLAFLAVNLALIGLRLREPGLKRPFRVPINVGPVPLPALAAIGAILVLMGFFEAEVYWGGALALAVGLALLLVRTLWRRRRR